MGARDQGECKVRWEEVRYVGREERRKGLSCVYTFAKHCKLQCGYGNGGCINRKFKLRKYKQGSQ